MEGEIIQVRDVPAEDVAVLKARAASMQLSLSAYLRRLIHDDTSRPSMADTLAQIATREHVEATSSDIASFIDADQRL